MQHARNWDADATKDDNGKNPFDRWMDRFDFNWDRYSPFTMLIGCTVKKT
jgi:hypothetical protein